MLRKTSDFFVRVAARWMPDPLVIAIFLTPLALISALLFTDFTTGQAIDAQAPSGPGSSEEDAGSAALQRQPGVHVTYI